MEKKKTVEETYRKLSQREHILQRPGMYTGSIKKQLEEMWVVEDDNNIKRKMISYSPGFLKIFDEVLTNSQDANTKDSTVNTIKIDFNKENGEISVFNNGKGIPVVIHKEHNIYVPELIFGHLLSGSNYNDETDRISAGLNGVGIKAVNIFSKSFTIETVDSENKLKFVQEYSDNMSKIGKAKITKNSGKSYVKVLFIPDYPRFGMQKLDDEVISLLKRRVYDSVVCTPKTTSIYLNGEKLKAKGLLDYIKFFKFDSDKVFYDWNENEKFTWEWAVVPSKEFNQVSFINGNNTVSGGTHVNYVLNQITSKLKVLIEKRQKIKEVKTSFVKDRLFLFLRATVKNPTFNSQTKETLTTQFKDFGCSFQISDKYIDKLYKSTITEDIVKMCKLKENMDLAKSTDGNQTKRLFIDKLEDANLAGTRKSMDCSLFLTEGLSASKFAKDGKVVIGNDYYGVYPLKGKGINVRDATTSQLINNEEINHIKQIIGLKQGTIYDSESIKKLRYGKIIMLTDADSVTADTPLLLQNSDGEICCETIERLSSNFIKNPLNNKEYGETNFKIWTEKGWTNIKNVIRHKVNKEIFRVVSHTGIVDVTEDHSLLNDKAEKISPKECVIGQKLLHSFPLFEENKIVMPDLNELSIKDRWKIASQCKIPYYQLYKKTELIQKLTTIKNEQYEKLLQNNIDEKEAYVMGLFFGDGSCGTYERTYKGDKKCTVYNWAISNNDITFLVKAKEILENIYYLDFKILNVAIHSHKLIVNGGKKTQTFVEKYINMFYYKNKYRYKNGNKVIPKIILNSNKKIREQFFIGFYNADGRGHNINCIPMNFDVESKISSQCLFILCKSLGYCVSLNTSESKPNVISFNLTKGTMQFDSNKIKKIISLGQTEQYVYDLETENHHFQAGIGQMIVHNTDGYHISALVMNVFHFWWPELIKLGFLQKMITPIVRAFNGKNTTDFYTLTDFNKYVETNKNNSTKYKYYKGLGTWEQKECKKLFENGHFKELLKQYIHVNSECDDAMKLAFEKTKEQGQLVSWADKRKEWLSKYDKSVYIKKEQKRISLKELVNNELIHFSVYDNLRSIPHYVDGLKPSQRKILYYMLKKNITQDLKVAQLSGYVSAETSYHHGEMSLQKAIIAMAQNFIGSNNVNLLYPAGNFGSRNMNGADAASPRYTFTRLSLITRLIFNQQDDELLNYLEDDGTPIEPEYFEPIIPMLLVNGSEGIGTGYSTYIPSYNILEIIDNLLFIIKKNGDVEDSTELKTLVPYYENFKGEIKADEENKGIFKMNGIYNKIDTCKIKITELPVNVHNYKAFIENKIQKQTKNSIVIKDYINNTRDDNIDIEFIIEFKDAETLNKMIKNGTLNKELKLTSTISTNNMYVFDENTHLVRYTNPNNLLLDFYDHRIDIYEKRRLHLMKKLKDELLINNNKIRFISEYLSNKIQINKKTKDQLIEQLKQRKYDTIENSFEYLYLMPMISLSKEKLNNLTDKINKLETELKYYRNTTNLKMWEKDLLELKQNLK